MNLGHDIQPALRELFASQRFAVLATDDCGQPFASLMAFAVTEDLRQIVVLTDRHRRKFSNLKTNCRVALLIDDRENKGSDTEKSVAVTAIGDANEVSRDIDTALRELFLVRHPNLAGFAATPTCTVVSVRITSYQLVSQFERIREWRPEATVTVSSQ